MNKGLPALFSLTKEQRIELFASLIADAAWEACKKERQEEQEASAKKRNKLGAKKSSIPKEPPIKT